MALSLLDTIGNTPVVQVTHLDSGPCELFVKLENQNPAGSIKDRIGLAMIEAAEQDGRLKPGGTIIEATAGNTGLGLALIAALRGYRLLLVIPDKMSREKIRHAKALGAEVVLVRSDVGKGHPDYYQDRAERLASEIPGSFYVNQFGNPANPAAHERTTGPEIWEQMEHRLDAVVCGVGSGGTLTGLSRYFSKVDPHVEMVLADPVGSILAHYIKTGEVLETSGSWLVEGIGEDFIPPIADLSRVKHAYTISDRESFRTARDLLHKEGILAGSSSGTLVAAALAYCREQTEKKRVLTFICDSGNKYLSKMFDDFWLHDQGFDRPAGHGDLRDVIARSHENGQMVTLSPDESLLNAYNRMRTYDVSQLPVVDGERICGILDESDVLLAIYQDRKNFQKPIREVMSRQLFTFPPETQIAALLPAFHAGLVPIITEGDKFLGIITRMDFVNYLRRTQNDV